MTAQGHDPLSIRLRQGGDRLLQGVPWLRELREFLSFRIPPTLKLVSSQAMLRLNLIVLRKSPRHFLRDLLHLEGQRLGGVTLSRLRGLRCFETGL